MRRLAAWEVLPTPEELAAQKRAASVQAEDAGIGQISGTVLGGALGALGFFGGPELGATTLQLGTQLGGAGGKAWGEDIGGDEAQRAAALVNQYGQVRAQKLSREQQRARAFAALINREAQ